MNELLYEPHEPYEIARRACFRRIPKAKDIDWKRFTSENTADRNSQFDNFAAFAGLCDISSFSVTELDPE